MERESLIGRFRPKEFTSPGPQQKLERPIFPESNIKSHSGNQEGLVFLSSEFQGQKGEEQLGRERFPGLPDGWEPMLHNRPNQPEHRFINQYGGNFSQRMIFNRQAIERFIRVGGFDGNIVLTDIPPSRRDWEMIVDAQAGEAAMKRGEILDSLRLKRIVEKPEYQLDFNKFGWTISINHQRIAEKLMEGGKRLEQKEFIQRFDQILRRTLGDCLFKEKLTLAAYGSDYPPIKDLKLYMLPYTYDALMTAYWLSFNALVAVGSGAVLVVAPDKFVDLWTDPIFIGAIMKAYTYIVGWNVIRKIIFGSNLFRYPLRRWKEIMLPPIQIDKFVVGKTLLNVPGRKLVAEKELLL